MARRRRPLVPDSRDGLDQLKARLQHVFQPEEAKFKAASELNIPLRDGDNGGLTARDAGRIGGQLGGGMVRELIRSAQQRMAERRP